MASELAINRDYRVGESRVVFSSRKRGRYYVEEYRQDGELEWHFVRKIASQMTRLDAVALAGHLNAAYRAGFDDGWEDRAND